MNKINGLTIGGSKLRVTFARFASNGKIDNASKLKHLNRNRQTKQGTSMEGYVIPRQAQRLVDGRRFVEVVQGRRYVHKESKAVQNFEARAQVDKPAVKELKGTQPKIYIDPDVNNLKWLKRSLVGFTKDIVDIERISSQLAEANVQFERLSAWGKHKFILTLDSEKMLNELLQRRSHLRDESFSEIRRWKMEDTSITGEGLWLLCRGVPLHCWSERTFDKIGSLLGKVLNVQMESNFELTHILVDRGKETQAHPRDMIVTLVCQEMEYPIYLKLRESPTDFFDEEITALKKALCRGTRDGDRRLMEVGSSKMSASENNIPTPIGGEPKSHLAIYKTTAHLPELEHDQDNRKEAQETWRLRAQSQSNFSDTNMHAEPSPAPIQSMLLTKQRNGPNFSDKAQDQQISQAKPNTAQQKGEIQKKKARQKLPQQKLNRIQPPSPARTISGTAEEKITSIPWKEVSVERQQQVGEEDRVINSSPQVIESTIPNRSSNNSSSVIPVVAIIVGTYILKNIFQVYYEFDKLLVYCKLSSFNENNKCFLHAVYFTLMGIDRL